MNNDNFIVILGWMINDLKLSGNELLVYALIYGFSQDGESAFTGTSKWIADTLAITQQSVFIILKNLVNKDLIIKMPKTVNGVTLVDYKTNFDLTLGGINFFDRGYQKTLGGSEKTLVHNNIDNNIDNNIKERNIIKKEKEQEPFNGLNTPKRKEEPNFKYDLNDRIATEFARYLEYRAKVLRKKYKTQNSLDLAFRHFKELCNGSGDMAFKIVNQTIMNEYTGLFPLNERKAGGRHYLDTGSNEYDVGIKAE